MTKTVLYESRKSDATIKLNDQLIEKVDDFKYLGSMIISTDADVKMRKTLAWSAFWKLKTIWFSRTIPNQLKIKIYKASCLSVLLYGCESWVLNQQQQESLNAFALKCYRTILGINRLDHVTNNEIYSTIKETPLYNTIKKRQLQFTGHILRMDEKEISHIYALYEPSGIKNKRGAPKMSYRKYIAKMISGNMELTSDEIKRYAMDRSVWKRLISDVTVDK